MTLFLPGIILSLSLCFLSAMSTRVKCSSLEVSNTLWAPGLNTNLDLHKCDLAELSIKSLGSIPQHHGRTEGQKEGKGKITLRKLKQEDLHKFRAILNYTVNSTPA